MTQTSWKVGSSLFSLHLQAIINCTVTPSMTFTKTSQKFGQWADSRANTVYGLGFATEQQLHQVSYCGWNIRCIIKTCYCVFNVSSPEPLHCLSSTEKSLQRSLKRWKMLLVWLERSRRIKNWPTQLSLSLLLRWALEENVNMKVEQTSSGRGCKHRKAVRKQKKYPVIHFWHFRNRETESTGQG